MASKKSDTAMDVDAMKQILKDAEAEFLPDVSKYIGKIYVSLLLELAGGEANAHFTTTREDWDLIQATHDDAFRLGGCCGKHSDITMGADHDCWRFTIAVEEDPYCIAEMVQMHGDSTPYWIEKYLAAEDEKEEK
jgi:hypothetical protein